MKLSKKTLEQIISGKTNLKDLPESLIFRGDLDLRYTATKELPDNLTVTGSLDLTNTAIKQLPDGLTVRGSLYLRHTEIKKLPDDLVVEGDLDLRHTDIQETPDSLTVGGRIDLGSADLEDLKEHAVKDDKIILERHEAIEILKALCRVEGCLMSNSGLQGAADQLDLVVKLITEKLKGDTK